MSDEIIKEHAVAIAEWVLRHYREKNLPYTLAEYAEIIVNAWKPKT